MRSIRSVRSIRSSMSYTAFFFVLLSLSLLQFSSSSHTEEFEISSTDPSDPLDPLSPEEKTSRFDVRRKVRKWAKEWKTEIRTCLTNSIVETCEENQQTEERHSMKSGLLCKVILSSIPPAPRPDPKNKELGEALSSDSLLHEHTSHIRRLTTTAIGPMEGMENMDPSATDKNSFFKRYMDSNNEGYLHAKTKFKSSGKHFIHCMRKNELYQEKMKKCKESLNWKDKLNPIKVFKKAAKKAACTYFFNLMDSFDPEEKSTKKDAAISNEGKDESYPFYSEGPSATKDTHYGSHTFEKGREFMDENENINEYEYRREMPPMSINRRYEE